MTSNVDDYESWPTVPDSIIEGYGGRVRTARYVPNDVEPERIVSAMMVAAHVIGDRIHASNGHNMLFFIDPQTTFETALNNFKAWARGYYI